MSTIEVPVWFVATLSVLALPGACLLAALIAACLRRIGGAPRRTPLVFHYPAGDSVARRIAHAAAATAIRCDAENKDFGRSNQCPD